MITEARAWAIAAVLLGVWMLFLGYISEGFWQSLWVQVGSTVVLVGPIVWLEGSFRDFTRQVKETKDDLKRTTEEMEALQATLNEAELRRTSNREVLLKAAGAGKQDAFLRLLQLGDKAIQAAGPRARLVGTGTGKRAWVPKNPGFPLPLEEVDVEDDLRVRFSVADTAPDVLLVHIEQKSGVPYKRLSEPAPGQARGRVEVGPVRWLAGQDGVALKESLAKAIAASDAPSSWKESVAKTLGLMRFALGIAADLQAGEAGVKGIGSVIEMLDDAWLVTSNALVNVKQTPWWIRKTIAYNVLDRGPLGEGTPDGFAVAEKGFKAVHGAILHASRRGASAPPSDARRQAATSRGGRPRRHLRAAGLGPVAAAGRRRHRRRAATSVRA